MPSCILKTCKNQSTEKKKDSGVTYHRFPRPGHERREEWIKFVQKNRNEVAWLPSNHTLICSDHFKNEDKYVTETGRQYLKKCAVPYNDSKPSTSGVEPISEPVSDSESIFDTPRKIVLKKKLSKVIRANKVLAVKFKKIQRQNRYLKRKCESYKLMIQDMKIKFGFDSQMENVLVHKAELVDLGSQTENVLVHIKLNL